MNSPGQQEDFITLPEREFEVLKGTASGLSEECAQQLGIAPRTVVRHVENLRNKPLLVVKALPEWLN